MSQSISIRPASTLDVPEIASILVDTWRATFRGMLSDTFLDGMSTDQQIERYHRIIAKPKVSCFVAAEPVNGIIGFCCGGPNRSSGLNESAEIYAIYVRNDQHRIGVGKMLFDATARQLLCTIGSGLAIWVIASNPSRPFYERMGGKETACGKVTLGTETVPQVAYTWHTGVGGRYNICARDNPL